MADLLTLPTFADDEAFRVVVESPRGSMLKLKYDPQLGAITLSRPLIAGLTYPYDWGFVPSTGGPDGDPLDAIVMWDGTSYPGVVLVCRAIGVLRLEQTNPTTHKRERNDRLAVLPIKAPRWDFVRSVADFSDRIRLELEQFFLAVVTFEARDVTLLGWGDARDAIGVVRGSQKTENGAKRSSRS